MYFEMIQQFCRTLRNLDAILEKAVRHAEARKFSPDAFLATRIAPDMLPFTRQIQIACDHAKKVASTLSGREAPKHEDSETTMEEIRERIRKCRVYLETFGPDDFASVTDKTVVKLPHPPGKGMHAPDALLTRVVPNFYFHITITYALLRAAGVEIGKKDYLGDIPMFDI